MARLSSGEAVSAPDLTVMEDRPKEVDHYHCARGCEKAQATAGSNGEWRCVNCGGDWIECTPEVCS